MSKKFLRFRYAAIKRYGDKHWTAHADYIEFNPNYTVSCGGCERGNLAQGLDRPFIFELSNGTKFLAYLHNYGDGPEDEILSEKGEVANYYAGDDCFERVKENIRVLNSY